MSQHDFMERYVRRVRPLTYNLAALAAVLGSCSVVYSQTLTPEAIKAAQEVTRMDPATLMALIAIMAILLAGYVYKTAIAKLDHIAAVMSGLECVQQRERKLREASAILKGDK